MKTARVFGTMFLAMTLVLGGVLAFLPLGEAAYEEGGTRTTETYSMFGKYRETTPAGEAADGEGGTSWSYFDAGLDARGGIDLLRFMGPALVIGLVFVFVGFILTVAPKTTDTVAGGFVALPGAVLILSSIVLAVLGTYMHADDLLGNGAQVNWNEIATTIAVLGILTSMISAGMGLVSARKHTTTAATSAGWETPAGWIAGRNLRCPDCSTVVTAGYGVVPICPSCSFGADYDGPAGPPVPSQAVGA